MRLNAYHYCAQYQQNDNIVYLDGIYHRKSGITNFKEYMDLKILLAYENNISDAKKITVTSLSFLHGIENDN